MSDRGGAWRSSGDTLFFSGAVKLNRLHLNREPGVVNLQPQMLPLFCKLNRLSLVVP